MGWNVILMRVSYWKLLKNVTIILQKLNIIKRNWQCICKCVSIFISTFNVTNIVNATEVRKNVVTIIDCKLLLLTITWTIYGFDKGFD